jgi:hypothetical protein
VAQTCGYPKLHYSLFLLNTCDDNRRVCKVDLRADKGLKPKVTPYNFNRVGDTKDKIPEEIKSGDKKKLFGTYSPPAMKLAVLIFLLS